MITIQKKNETPYVLISPARNEERYITKALDSVVCQTVLPCKWVIVSDGSTDRTDEIVSKYAADHKYIQLLRISRHNSRNFSSKVNAFRAGYDLLKDLEYNFIGNLDADVSFEPHYFERILQKFLEISRLGIGGGIILELQNGVYKERSLDRAWNVTGAIQLFRRQCYEEIGGFIPLKVGGEDTVAQIMARMYGWEVKSFNELKVQHHKPTGTSVEAVWRTRLNAGIQDRMVGYHPIYFIAKCFRRVSEKPYLLGSLLRMFGYCWSVLIREEMQVTEDFIRFHRRQQLNRLKSQLKFGRKPGLE
jgi:biofilm PGA synthesis N-glycosyltransferase PgaC